MIKAEKSISIGIENMKSDGRRRGPMQNTHFSICKKKGVDAKNISSAFIDPSKQMIIIPSSMITLLYPSKSKTKAEN
jgi:hypothetical protein